MKTTLATPTPEPLGVPSKTAKTLLGGSSVLKNAVKSGSIKPVVKGGRGKTTIYDLSDLRDYWKLLKGEGGFTMFEVLGVIAVVAALSTVVILAADWGCAVKESGIARQEQVINSAYQNFIAAGGEPQENAAAALESLKEPIYGVGPFLPDDVQMVVRRCSGEESELQLVDNNFTYGGDGGSSVTPDPSASPAPTASPSEVVHMNASASFPNQPYTPGTSQPVSLTLFNASDRDITATANLVLPAGVQLINGDTEWKGTIPAGGEITALGAILAGVEPGNHSLLFTAESPDATSAPISLSGVFPVRGQLLQVGIGCQPNVGMGTTLRFTVANQNPFPVDAVVTAILPPGLTTAGQIQWQGTVPANALNFQVLEFWAQAQYTALFTIQSQYVSSTQFVPSSDAVEHEDPNWGLVFDGRAPTPLNWAGSYGVGGVPAFTAQSIPAFAPAGISGSWATNVVQRNIPVRLPGALGFPATVHFEEGGNVTGITVNGTTYSKL